MVGPNLKEETLKLMDTKNIIETEIDVVISRLCSGNGAGLSGSLLDDNGFPRTDIDVATARADRHLLAVLRTDLSSTDNKIEQNLYALHAVAAMKKTSLPQKRSADGLEVEPSHSEGIPSQSSEGASSSRENVTEAEPINEDKVEVEQRPSRNPRVPFAVFDLVEQGSPAQQGGIMLGDLLVMFGSVTADNDYHNPNEISLGLFSEGRRNEGRHLRVVVLRQGSLLVRTVIPRPWAGHGLLGCHIRPL